MSSNIGFIRRVISSHEWLFYGYGLVNTENSSTLGTEHSRKIHQPEVQSKNVEVSCGGLLNGAVGPYYFKN